MNDNMRWLARGVFNTTEGAPTNGGGLDQHLLAVYGQGQDAPESVAADHAQEQTRNVDAQAQAAPHTAVDTEDTTAQPEETPQNEEEHVHVLEITTPPLVAEVFGTSPFIDATPVKEKAQKKKPAKKNASSK